MNGDGDASSANSFNSWETAPHLVLRKLFYFLSKRDLRTVRLVCKLWRQAIDFDFGLSVIVNETLPGNIEFLQDVNVRSIQVKCWENADVDLLWRPTDLLEASIIGPINETWITNVLFKQCKLLTKLTLGKTALFCQEIVSNVSQNIILPHLEVLEVKAKPKGHGPRDARRFAPLPHLFEVMESNMYYLLTHLKSESLRKLEIYVLNIRFSPEWQFASSETKEFLKSVNWRFEPLEAFLETHARSLRHLFLDDFHNKSDDSPANNDVLVPTQLRSIQIDLFNTATANNDHWKKLLQVQTKLRILNLFLYNFSFQWTNSTISSVCEQNTASLTSIQIQISYEHTLNNQFTLDASSFANCTSLNSLCLAATDFVQWETECGLINLFSLPKSLVFLEIVGFTMHLPSPYENDLVRKTFPGLQSLILETIYVSHLEIPLGDDLVDKQLQATQAMKDIIPFSKDCLAMRKLSNLKILLQSEILPRHCPEWINMLKWLYTIGSYAFLETPVQRDISYEQIEINYINSPEYLSHTYPDI